MKKVLIIFMAVFPFLCCAGRSHGAAEPPFVADTLSGAGEAAATDRIRIRFADTVPLPREARYGLHLWYEVRTDGRMPVAEVVQVFAALPAVAYAGFVYRAELAD